MNIIVCLDDNYGMTYNKKRLSRDRKILDELKESLRGKVLWINNYSKDLFTEDIFSENIKIVVDDKFLDKAKDQDYCFVENNKLSKYKDKIKKVIVYSWNRTYPSDQKFDIDLFDFDEVEEMGFSGKSHNIIVKKTYERKRKAK
jgi:hypothetical protein